MTGPEHYREAERLLIVAEKDMCTHAAGNIIEHDTQVARAQVHATLAHAAAVIDTMGQSRPVADSDQWKQVLS